MEKKMFLCWLKTVLVSVFVSFAFTAAAQNYYPAEVGNTWVLENVEADERRTYSLGGPETVNRTEVITLKIETKELSTGNVVDTDKYFLTVGNDAIKLHGTILEEAAVGGTVTANFPSPATFFPLHLSLGDKWQIIADAEVKTGFLKIGGKSTTNLEVVGFEDLQTPAGTFHNCAKVELALTFSTAGGFINIDSTTYQWLAPDIGPIQYQNSDGLRFRLTSTNLPLVPEESDTMEEDVAPLGPTNVRVTSVDAIDSVFEAAEDGSYAVGGLVDKYDEAVPSPVATFTLEPTADRKTYESVKFVTDIENLVIGEVTETEEGSGVFIVTVDVGTLADGMTYLENGTYMFHALAFDDFGNVQEDMSETDGSKISVIVENSYRPAPAVLSISVDQTRITQTNPDSGAPQGTIKITASTPAITSPPISVTRYEVKRPSDTTWGDVGTSATRGTWELSVDTTMLPDSITAEDPGARDYTLDNNQYMVRATAIAAADGSETLSADSVSAMFSVDNVDDVAPLGPTNVRVTSVDAIDSVFEAAEDGSYAVGGLVDKYDEAVPSPVATFTLEPTADRKTYESVKFVTDIENLVIGEVTETEEGSGVFIVTVDVGTLADGMTYLENGTYMFHALAFDDFGNVQEDMSETDGSKISVIVENSYRPAPEALPEEDAMPELSPYDVNADGVVNILDLTFVAARFGEMDAEADVNGDGIVNILDLVRIAQNFSN